MSNQIIRLQNLSKKYFIVCKTANLSKYIQVIEVIKIRKIELKSTIKLTIFIFK